MREFPGAISAVQIPHLDAVLAQEPAGDVAALADRAVNDNVCARGDFIDSVTQ